MTQVILNIPDGKLDLVRLLAKELNFVVVDEKRSVKKLNAKQREWVDQLRKSLDEVDQHTRGEITLKTAQQLLDEL